MANRTMQQKELKMRRQRRAWAKSLTRSGGKQPNRDVIKMYKHHARGLEDETFVDTVADLVAPFADKQKLKRQAELEAGMPPECTLRVLGPTGRDQLQESWIYFNSRKTCFVLVHMDLEQRIELRSTTYSSKELLVMCWEGGRVDWVDKKSIQP